MFPRQLSEQLFSFKEGGQSPALSIWMRMAEDGSLDDCGVACSTVSCRRLTYAEVNQRLAGDPEDNADLHQLHKVPRSTRCKLPLGLSTCISSGVALIAHEIR